MCTRSGASARISSTRGFFVPPTRGNARFGGKMQKSVIATTASPAPSSKSVSVIEGTSDTTRRGMECGSRSCRFRMFARSGCIQKRRLRPPHSKLTNLFAVFRIERVDQPVAQKVQSHHGGHDRGAGEDGQMIGEAEVLATISQHRAPGRSRRLHSQSEKRQ